MAEFLNAAGFAKDLMQMVDKSDADVNKVIRKACMDLYKRIVERSPVDTGRLKANWQISTGSIGSGAEHEPPGRGADKGYTYNEIQTIINKESSGFKLKLHDDVVTIYNNLKYAEYIENGTSPYGFSRQAPQGMVAVSIAEFEAHFKAALEVSGF